MANTDLEAVRWRKTRNLMLTCLTIWVLISFVVNFWASALNSIVIMGFPLGFYMAAQGALIVFVVMLFWFAATQNRIDDQHGASEDL
ncbi:MAG: DUF4212 domain-containing protein [Hyphomicrobiaceae bacterium]|nr:DUF4212 domain-containing protein [Hyphomicrobiaceae bacterium]